MPVYWKGHTSRWTSQLLAPSPDPSSKWYAGGLPSKQTAQQVKLQFLNYYINNIENNHPRDEEHDFRSSLWSETEIFSHQLLLVQLYQDEWVEQNLLLSSEIVVRILEDLSIGWFLHSPFRIIQPNNKPVNWNKDKQGSLCDIIMRKKNNSFAFHLLNSTSVRLTKKIYIFFLMISEIK